MSNVLIVVAVVAAAYLLTHKVVEGLRDRFLVATGAEYLFVGFVLGPHGPGAHVLTAEALPQLAPVVVLATGWVGLLYGMNANLRQLVDQRDRAGTLAVTEAVVSGGLVGVAAWALLRTGLFVDLGGQGLRLAVWALAASAAVGSASVVELVRRRYGASGPLATLLDRAAREGELLSIVAFGLLSCFHHPPGAGFAEGWNYANWIVVTAGLGLGLGVLFRLFLGRDLDADRQFLALVGIVVFAGGAAWALGVSPLLVNLVLGMVLANVAPDPERLSATLARYHRAMIIVLLVFAGAWWSPIPVRAWVVVGAYVFVRAAGKLLGGAVAAGSADGGAWRRDVGRGLLGHGEVAVAMALDLGLSHEGPAVDLAFTAILASVMLSDLASARLLRGLLVDAGEIAPGAGEVAAGAGEG